jgi:hypothetical protein
VLAGFVLAGRVRRDVGELDALAAAAAGIATVLRTAVQPGWLERRQPEHELDPERRRPGITVPGTAVDERQFRLGRQPAERLFLQ